MFFQLLILLGEEDFDRRGGEEGKERFQLDIAGMKISSESRYHS